MSRHWLQKRERSGPIALRALVWTALVLGRRVARCVLVPVAAYFLLFDKGARAASRDYLARIIGRKPPVAMIFRHIYTFATAALDRIYFLTDRWSLFDVRVHGEKQLIEQQSRNNGCFLVGAHIGSFEVLRSLGRRRNVSVNLVMFEDNAKQVARVTRAINPQLDQVVIELGSPDSMLRVIEQLDKGAWVGMLGDRAISDKGMVQTAFLGGTAAFPRAPFRIAALTGRPVILMLGIYRGANRYDLYFETLVETTALPTQSREQVIEQWINLYASRLEHYCREAPLNWFNFYSFWSGDENAS